MGAIKRTELNRIVKFCYCQLFLREMNLRFDKLWRACLLQKIKSFVMTTMYLLFSEIYNCYLTCNDHITLQTRYPLFFLYYNLTTHIDCVKPIYNVID